VLGVMDVLGGLDVLGVLAQAESAAAEDPDLTVPILAIGVCVALIIVTLFVSGRSSRRRRRTATPEDIDAWQLDGGRLLDQWIDEVEAEVQARRTSPDPANVTRNDEPLGLDRAVAECPDGALGALIADLRAAGRALLAAVRDGDPHGPPAVAAEARFDAAKADAGAFLGSIRAPAPQQ
jgi:hypothetical protein